MAFPVLSPLRALLADFAGDTVARAGTRVATGVLAGVAGVFWLAAGVVSLSRVTGFPVAALVFGAGFACVALAVHLTGRSRARRRALRMARDQASVMRDLAVATALSRPMWPLVPAVAFVAAFLLARRS